MMVTPSTSINLVSLCRLLIIFLSLKPSSYSASSTPSAASLSKDSNQVLSFKSSLLSPNPLPDWLPTNSPCNFTGVTCTNYRVSSINLDFVQLSTDFSSVSSFLLSLTNLESLSLKSSNLSGSITSITKTQCSSELISVDLAENSLAGPISDIQSFAPCSALTSLNLSQNFFDFNLAPKALSNGLGLNFATLDLSYNKISGQNAVAWLLSDGCENLQNFSLKGNKVSGELPVTNCRSLEYLDLSANNFTTEFPLFTSCSSLQHLDFSSNKFSGDVAASLSSCKSLTYLNLSNNLFSGDLPAFSGVGIQYLYLSGNDFSGELTDNITGSLCSSLVELDLSANNLSGSVIFGNDGSQQCHGAGNLLEFGGIRRDQLDRLSSRHPCNFTRVYGGITQPTFNHNGSMILLDLSYNQLEGSIPKELGSMYCLSVLNLGHNDLSGPIPPELQGLKMVDIVDLSYNKLNGSIPQSLTSLAFLGAIDLSNNELSGLIPQSAPLDTLPAYGYLNNSGLCGYPLPNCGSDSGLTSSGLHQKSHRREASLAGSVAIGLLFAMFCIFCFIIVAVKTRRRRKNEEAIEA